jgi:hypothetical protein
VELLSENEGFVFMRKFTKQRGIYAVIAIFALLYGGCMSVAEKGGRFLDGGALHEKKTAQYRGSSRDGGTVNLTEVKNRGGKTALVISFASYPSIEIRCSTPDAQGNFYFTSLDYLGGSVSGWNEFTMDLSGTARITAADPPAGGRAVLTVPDSPESAQISSGKILRNGTRLTGSEALSRLRSRRERILALTGWMRNREDVPSFPNQNSFSSYWKPLLLPEIMSKKKRPAAYTTGGARRVKAEDVRWNTNYTEIIFPEELRVLRDSGALLRDWEEALQWIYYEYQWEKIAADFARGITLTKIK